MKLENTYLSDEELEQLILSVEQNELVAAPPDLRDEILANVEVQEHSKHVTGQNEIIEMALAVSEPKEFKQATEQNHSSENKIKEFRRYCFRVITSAAAAIALVFFAPDMENTPKPEVPSRQEVAKRSITREEALDDTGILIQILDSSKLFDRELK